MAGPCWEQWVREDIDDRSEELEEPTDKGRADCAELLCWVKLCGFCPRIHYTPAAFESVRPWHRASHKDSQQAHLRTYQFHWKVLKTLVLSRRKQTNKPYMYNCMNRVIHINFEGKTEIVGGSEFAVYVGFAHYRYFSGNGWWTLRKQESLLAFCYRKHQDSMLIKVGLGLYFRALSQQSVGPVALRPGAAQDIMAGVRSEGK